MARVRVLVVDDSVVIRKIVSEELNAVPDIEVVGTAANGHIAISKLSHLNPDLVILDVEMPELDGLATLAALRKTHPRLPVIMFSALTERGAAETLEALSLGASDYFTKPTGTRGVDESRRIIREQLGPAILALCKPSHTTSKEPPPSIVPPAKSTPVEVVAIGVSTGGPNALQEVIPKLPANFRVPILIVQHMPPMFTRLLAERLAQRSKIPVVEATNGMIVLPSQAYIAPGDFHMILARDGTRIRILLNQDAPENSCRPSVDPLFRSVAKLHGSGTLAAVMTGMGNDGLRGAEVIRAVGGQILVQDETSSVVWGMPGYVARAGLANKIVPLSTLATEIVARVSSGIP